MNNKPICTSTLQGIICVHKTWRRSVFPLILFLFSNLAIYAQNEGNIWHFGIGGALDFNGGTAQITTPSQMWTLEGSASVCDVNGNLLFYSNGGGRDPITSGQSSGKIWNRQHQVMYDMGFTEGGGFSAAQSSVIIPRPGVTGNYYLFTMEEVEFQVGGDVPSQPQGRGLSVFEVDMALNGGLGGVVGHQDMLYLPTYEGLCAVRHANGFDYWIIVHQFNSPGLVIYPVNGLGVGQPKFFDTGFLTGSMIKASPDGKWITCFNDNGQQVLFSFNPSTGVISNPLILNAFPNFVEFSPNSKRLFMTIDNQVQFYDLTAPDINAGRTVVEDFPGFDFGGGFNYIIGQMQLAPDGKIYMLRSNFVTDSVWISAIACPNSSPYLEIDKFGFYAGPDQTFFGLPNFDNGIFRSDADYFNIELGENRTLCNGESLTLDPGIANGAYIWSTGNTTQTLPVETSGLYKVTVTTGCGTGVDSIQVNAVNVAAFAGNDTAICQGNVLMLNGAAGGTINWSPETAVDNAGSLSPNFTGTETTTLTLTAESDGCTASDQITVSVLPAPVAVAQPADTSVLEGSPVQVNVQGGSSYIWSPADGFSCTDCPNPVITSSMSATYTVTVTNNQGCSATTEVTISIIPPDCDTKIPNAFSPNGDLTNEDFKPVGRNVTGYELAIYNRWGRQIFAGSTPWDGKIDGSPAPVDVYFYRTTVSTCGEEKFYTGEVSVIR